MTNDRVLPPVILFLTSFCILDSSFFLPFKPVLSYFSSLSSSCSSFLFFPAFLLLPIGFWPSVTLLKLPTTATPPSPPPPLPAPSLPPPPPPCSQLPPSRLHFDSEARRIQTHVMGQSLLCSLVCLHRSLIYLLIP